MGAKPIKFRPSRLERAGLPSVSRREENNAVKETKVDATMVDHLFAWGPTHSWKTQDHYLMQFGSVVLPRCEVFLEVWSNIERLSSLVGRVVVPPQSCYILSAESWQDSVVWIARYEVQSIVYRRWEEVVVSSQRTFLDQEWQRAPLACTFEGAVRVSERNTQRVNDGW